MDETRVFRSWLSPWMFGVYLFLYAPIVVLIVFSFNDSRFTAEWAGFTTKWYGALFSNREWVRTGWNSLVIASISTVTATALGTMVALGLERTRFRAKSAAVALLYLPIVVPDLIMGISLAVFYFWTGIELGKKTVVFAHVAFNISFVAVIVRARIRSLPPQLEEAALDLGATRWVAFWRVQFPLISSAVMSGALLAFTNSIDDFVVTYFTAGPGATTLSLKIFSTVRFGVTPEVNAVSALLLLNSTVLILLSLAMTAKSTPAKPPASE
ncbi:MAG: ABC transporter permease [Candidatus Poribacteria bacterium]|nr:ABC transporter permease [Candidatus Poribacteria bacterium]